MTVLDPAIDRCPLCGSTSLSGDMRVHHRIELDGEGGIMHIEQADDSTAFESLACDECGHQLIENGEMVGYDGE